MSFDALEWLIFVITVVTYFLLREIFALAKRDDARFTLSNYIRQLQRAMGKTGGKTITGVILSTLFVYLMGHLVLWVW